MVNPGFIPSLAERVSAHRIKAANSVKSAIPSVTSYVFALDPSKQPSMIRLRTRLYLELFDRPFYEVSSLFNDASRNVRQAFKDIELYAKILGQNLTEIQNVFSDDDIISDQREFAILTLSDLIEPAEESYNFLEAAQSLIRSSYDFYQKTDETPKTLSDIEDHVYSAWLNLR